MGLKSCHVVVKEGEGGDVEISWGPMDGGLQTSGALRLSDVAVGGMRLVGGGISIRLAPANLAKASRETGGLMMIDFFPLPPPAPQPSEFFNALMLLKG